MRTGSYAAVLEKSALKRLARRWLGTPDLHSHFRLAPLVRHAERLRPRGPVDSLAVLEFGCGDGVNLFELAARMPIRATGYDLSEPAIQRARRIADALGISTVEFRHEDATGSNPDRRADLILLIDFLEHIPEPQAFLTRCDAWLKPGGQILISVPAPRYPRVFGRRFANAIGHLVDGYQIEDLAGMAPPGYRLITWKYNTGVLASALCALHFRLLGRLRMPLLARLLQVPGLLLSGADWINGRRVSSSVFAAFEKPSDHEPSPRSAVPQFFTQTTAAVTPKGGRVFPAPFSSG
ncbi:MAG TPA: class I SAM-dependent methyltransferase [Bryobacteraceae bacterium]|nr:class I SAM-dependent methyltransferase [Bryobacteraceae bacterium]